MTLVATMTQTMRAHHCATFLRQVQTESTYVVVSDARAFDTFPLPSNSTLIEAKPPHHILPTGRFMKSRMRQRIVNYSRGGSSFGQLIERNSRKILWHLRYVDRLVLAKGDHETEGDGKVHQALLEILQDIHSKSPITQLVAFDVFDLPTLLRFQEKHQVDVVVR